MPNNPLPRSAPEAQGIPSSAILAFVEAVETADLALHSVMLLRHGSVVAEGWWQPYGPENPHMLFSLSKSFTSTAIGLAVAEGRLSLDDLVLPFFPDDAPANVNEHLAAMRVRHLLSMSTGHVVDSTPTLHTRQDGNWAKAFFEVPVERPPGTHFVYNSGATYMLSAIIQHVTGGTLLEYLRPRLLDPLGIDYATWQSCPRGINVGGWGLSITTDSIARFGQLYLQKGAWQGQQLISEEWVAEASRSQVDNSHETNPDWAQGYGYQFWRCRHGAYRGDGAFGQFCVIMPEQDAVLAITSGLENMQAVLDLVWAHLLPAFGAAPLPENAAEHGALLHKLERLALPTQSGEPTSAAAASSFGRTYSIPPNDQRLRTITLEAGDEPSIALVYEQGTQRIRCGSGAWRTGQLMMDGGAMPIAASGAWTDERTFVAKVWFYETPFQRTLQLRFDGDALAYDVTDNVSFGPKEHPQLVGRLQEPATSS